MITDRDGTPYFVFDAHTHMGRRAAPMSLTPAASASSPEAMIADMDAAGVDRIVTFPLANPHTDYRAENERLIAAMRAFPGRIVAFARLQPFFMDSVAADIADYASQGVRGLKLHLFLDGGGYPANDRRLIFPILEEARRHSLVVLFHSGESWNTAPSLIGDAAREFPGLTVIIAHAGLWGFHEEAIAVARQIDNVYVDVAEVSPPGVITQLVNEIGEDRVLYGSDHPMIPFGFEIGKVAKYAGLTPQAIAKVLGQNLARILELDSEPTTAPVALWDI